MNDPEFKSPFPSSNLAAQVASLQRQVSTLLLVLLVVSATLAAYLRYQDYIYHKDAAAIRPQAMQVINTFNTATAGINRQAVQDFLKQLVIYGQKNPDFAQQVLKKYGFAPQPAAPKK
jgi:tRNA U34 5-carboxymethylaminomethyl modifying GTPase MnmE/TrmE